MAIAFGLLIVVLTGLLVHQMRHPPRHTAGYAVARGLACDPSDIHLAFEEWRLERPDGETVPVWEIKTDRRPSDDECRLTGVFVHGWGHSRIDALARVEPFVPLLDRIVLYDLRGHGEAQHSSSRLGQRDDDDLVELIHRLGDGRFVLVGHSMGAVIAIRAVGRMAAGHRIAGVIAYGPYCAFDVSLRGRLRVAGFPTRPITDLALLTLRCIGVTPLSLDERDVARMNCPLLVIHGRADGVSPIGHARRLASAAGGQLEEIEGAGHLDPHTVDADQHAEIVRRFLERLRGDGRSNPLQHAQQT